MEYLILSYAVLFVTTWGALYSYIMNEYPSGDSTTKRSKLLGFVIVFSIFQPMAFVVTMVRSYFFCHGFQWWGGPKSRQP